MTSLIIVKFLNTTLDSFKVRFTVKFSSVITTKIQIVIDTQLDRIVHFLKVTADICLKEPKILTHKKTKICKFLLLKY